jgi:ABC-type dipeptide/oligopeptide/nickel transport system permease component
MHYNNRPVTQIIAQAFPYSFDLGIRSLIFATIMGVLLVSLPPLREVPNGIHSMFIAIIGVSVPFYRGIPITVFPWIKIVPDNRTQNLSDHRLGHLLK